MQILRDLTPEIRRAEVWVPWAFRGLRVLLILAIAYVLTRLTGRLLRQLHGYALGFMGRHGSESNFEAEKRASTIVATLRKMAVSLIWLMALGMSLYELQYNIAPLLAGLGVAGIAVGLGAQSLIKDWLGGLFLLLEDQIRIGDAVKIGDVSGSVEEINLRTTILRGENGAVHIIPNGSINTLTNLTREYAYFLFETTLAHRADANKALEILAATGAEIAAEEAYKNVILAPLEIIGVDKLGDRGAVIRARLKALPSQQWGPGRELNRRVKQRFDEAGIAFPPPPP
ncbi:MAG TPA: mechanosensitive ion channel family protein [Bryobacteraceae bacterium]|jgi:small conductance mechanosensitive channel